jgi:hypothetical protein
MRHAATHACFALLAVPSHKAKKRVGVNSVDFLVGNGDGNGEAALSIANPNPQPQPPTGARGRGRGCGRPAWRQRHVGRLLEVVTTASQPGVLVLGGHIQRSGRAISHTKALSTRPSHPPSGITHQTPKRKEEVENKSIFRPFGAHLTPSEHLPHHDLGRPNPPTLAYSAPSTGSLRPQAASGCAIGVPCRSTATLDIHLKPRIPPPYPATLAPVFEPLPSAVLHYRLQGYRATRD